MLGADAEERGRLRDRQPLMLGIRRLAGRSTAFCHTPPPASSPAYVVGLLLCTSLGEVEHLRAVPREGRMPCRGLGCRSPRETIR